MKRAAFWFIPGSACGLAAIFAGASPMAVAAAVFGGWTLAGAMFDGWMARQLAGATEKSAAAGRALAHAGVAFVALGAVADSTGMPESTRLLVPGESMEFAGRTLSLNSVGRADGPNYLADQAELDLSGSSLNPERRFYPTTQVTTREVAIHSELSGDYYVALGEPRARQDGHVAYEVRASFNPMTWLLGLGAILVIAGGGLAFGGRFAFRNAS